MILRPTCFFIVLPLLLISAASADLYAQSITIDDGTDSCTADLLALEIEPGTGDVTVDVASLEDCLGTAFPTVNTFTVDGAQNATINEGTPVEVAWNSTNTSSCESGGTLPSWVQLDTLTSDGSIQASTSGLPNNDYTLTLSCIGPDDSAQAPDLTVTVENSSATNDCATRLPPANLARATSILVSGGDNASEYSSVFGGPFPGDGSGAQIAILDGQYAAMRFTTGNILATAIGQFQSTILQPLPNNTATGGDVNRLWSISKCPGDFRKTVLDSELGPGCVQGGTDQSAFEIGGTDAFNDSGQCALESNTTYFLNLLYTNEAPPTTETEHAALQGACTESKCGNIIGLTEVGID